MGCDREFGPRGGAATDAGAQRDVLPSQPADVGWPLGPPPSSLGTGFVEVPWPAPEPSPFPQAGLISNDGRGLTGAIAADLDGDGDPEAFVGAVAGPQMGDPERALPFARRYRRAEGRLVPAAIPLRTEGTLPLALLDLDGDGHRDLVDNYPAISWGAADGGFDPSTALLARPADGTLFEGMAAAAVDLDADGWLDLIVGNHNCCTRCLAAHPLLRVGPRAFASRDDLFEEMIPGGAYALLATPLAGEGTVLGVMSECRATSPSWFRARALGDDGVPRFEPFDPTPADASYRAASPDFCANGLACGAPMAGAVAYLDEDDRLDLSVSLHNAHTLFRGTAAFPLGAVPPQPGFTILPGPAGLRPMIPWGIAFVDVDRDGRAEMLTAHGDDFIPEGSPETVGPQRVTLHWNAGGMRFAELSTLAGLARLPGQWRSIFVTDLDADGDADLLVGGHGRAPMLLRNEVATENRGLALALRGTSSNAYGLGATVVVTPEGGAPARYLMGGQGTPHAVSEPLIFAGLGRAARAEVEVRWPSGVVQRVQGVEAGGLRTIEEPSLFAISPPTRHAPADGVAVVQLRVTPRDINGNARADARVEVAITHGPGAVAEVAPAGVARMFVVRGTGVAGSTRLELRVDGVASPIHPRVWWDPTG